ncbi:hypothetical protein ABHI18_000023 [Aspergillus niger]
MSLDAQSAETTWNNTEWLGELGNKTEVVKPRFGIVVYRVPTEGFELDENKRQGIEKIVMIQAAANSTGFEARGSLAFIPEWTPATHLDPHFYEDGTPFYAWANAYQYPLNESRVVQTARAFVNGYLYEYADTSGTVVSVNSTGSSDILFFPYLCAYGSQIIGRLSAWCSVFADDELRNYAYSQDLSYYYRVGPGSVGPAKVLFLPFLNSLMDLLSKGPGQIGTDADEGNFTAPNLIMGFLNDNQIAEMTAAMGIFDDEPSLPIDQLPTHHQP